VSDETKTDTTADAPTPTLPESGLQVDFGTPAPGFTEPMPIARRNGYEARIRQSVDTQAAGAEKASQLFIR